jgi:hypothetical protein
VDFWLYPGAYVNVNMPTKVTMVPVAPGEVPPPGVTVIPPQSSVFTPLGKTIEAAAQANLDVARQGLEAAQSLTTQQTAEAQAAFDAALIKSNQEAAKLVHTTHPVQPGQPPPWEVTFTEKRT